MQVNILDDDDIRRIVREEVGRVFDTRADDPWLNSDESAEYLGIARSTIYDLIADGKLPRVGGRKTKLMFRRSTLDAYIEARGTNPLNEGGER